MSVKVKLNRNGSLTLSFQDITCGKFLNLYRAVKQLSAEGSALAEETRAAIVRAVDEAGYSDLVTQIKGEVEK
jgi:hypothetical protein